MDDKKTQSKHTLVRELMLTYMHSLPAFVMRYQDGRNVHHVYID